ncbi:uncharacterized protein LOC143212211 isoform X2 [Lasioglossum baleicum]|uniref:uncharacterized protein LOC143212211 isoform X2 n=1 Tax=Lasioglossum baleicum TaxID=434251 RepID=UPI003FCD085B
MRTVRSNNVTMDLDRELTGIFREVVQFLECLRDIKLPVTLENLRNNLLKRSKQTLTTFAAERFGTRASPEPYLNMSPAAIRPKGLMPTIEKGSELEEYVGAEEPPKQKQQQDYYESFQTVEANHAAAVATTIAPNSSSSTSSSSSASTFASGMSSQPQVKDEKKENALLEIYASFPAAEVRSKCQKCGPLYRKEGKKLFVFEQYRTCWVGLVGSHLLIYGNDRDSRPYMVLPIRGYMARAAPNANLRDQRKSESTFEIFCPGNKTFQFVARTPKDMEQWVAKICELGAVENSEVVESQEVLIAASPETGARLSLDLDPPHKEEQYQDVGCFSVDKPESEVAGKFIGIVVDGHMADSKNAHTDLANLSSCSMVAPTPVSIPSPIPVSFPGPPLPARIPRRLPSLPIRGSSTSSSSSYIHQDEEEDDIYHKIEDFRNEMTERTPCYGNVATRRTPKRSKKNPGSDVEYSNGSRSEATDGKENEKEKEKKNENNNDADTGDNRIDEREESYDDVESLLSRSGPKPGNERPKVADKATESTKSPQKKSFLDRVRSLKESPRKGEKKTKEKDVTPPSIDVQRLSTYDDVSGLINVQQEEKKKRVEEEEEEGGGENEEESEYTCPPPPRPIYANPPTVADAIAAAHNHATAVVTRTATCEEELYDDVSSCRRNYKEQETRQLDRVETKSSHVQESARRKLDKSVPGDDTKRPKSQASFEESEHYQTPRQNSNRYEHPVAEQEELYDDIAILAEFTARQKECRNSRDSEEAREIKEKAQASPEKRSWNRFVGGKRSKLTDSVTNQETNTSRNSNGTERVDDLAATRMNSFQKLISKMENSLGKGSVKTTPTMLPNRTHVTDNA